MTPDQDNLIDISDLRFGWPGEDDFLHVARFSMQKTERIFLEGPSGTGKSTLLGLISGVLAPRAGNIRFDGTDIVSLSAARRDRLRADRMGVIFQLFNLLPYLSLVDNVTLPCRFSKQRRQKALERSGSLDEEARRLLARLGLSDMSLLSKQVSNLSVGQQQRVAAARALIGAPDLIIADEPTSALDTATRDAFLHLLMEEAEAANAGLLFVSHDKGLGEAFERRLSLYDLNTLVRETAS